MSPPFFLVSLSPLLAAVLLQLLSSNVHTTVHASITICSRPAAWTLHDVVSQLLSSQQIDLNNSSISLLNSTNSSTSTNSQLNLQLISKNAASSSSSSSPSSSSENGPLITNLSLPITNSSEFSRRLFGDHHHHHQESVDKDNVTLVVLTSSSERRLSTEQQLLNLEAIYQTLLGVHLTSLRFVLLNSRTSFDLAWVAATRRRVSFEVYQELPTGPPALDGRNGDIFIYDRCGFLTYYIPFPLSFIHTQQPILQAAVLATYFDSPCKAKCNSSTTSASVSATPIANVTEAVLTVTTATPATTVSSLVEATATEAAAAATVVDAADNQTDYSSPSSSSFLNDSLLPMVNLTAEQVGNFNDMGQILLKFFGQIAAEQQQQQQQQANNQQENAVTAVNLEATTNQTNTTANVDGSSVKSNVTSSTLSISSNGNSSSSSSSSLSVLDRLRGSQRPRLEVTTCTATVCNEWSTERLLKARLCCLNSPEGESSSSSSSISEANSTMITSTTVSPGNSSSSSSSSSSPSGFGCTLYARRNQCSQIMPVIRCCLRKVLNKYFDFTIRLREQQQRSQGGGGGGGGGGGNGGGGRQLGSLTVDHTESIGGGQSLATSGGSAGGNGGGGLPREVVSLEYPADYVLGGVQQSDYLKQQHRKRVNRRVVGGGGGSAVRR